MEKSNLISTSTTHTKQFLWLEYGYYVLHKYLPYRQQIEK